MTRLTCLPLSLALLVWFAPQTQAQMGTPSSPTTCENHMVCDADSACIKGQCLNLVGRTLILRVESASITPKTRDGEAWDCDETPDPYVTVFFPNQTELMETKVLEDTLKPEWQESVRIVVPKSDRSIWFCLFDDDTFGSDDIRIGKEGGTNCVGYKDLLDLVRLGQSKLETQGELEWILVGAGLE